MDQQDQPEIKENKSLWVFGRDVSKVPCFRSSFLYGIGGGIGVGLLTFLFTSRPQFATHCAMGSFCVTTIIYWTQCRYHYSKTKFEMSRIRAGLQKHIIYEGTQAEKNLNKLTEEKPVDA